MGIMQSLKDSMQGGLLSPFNLRRWIGGDNIKNSSRTVHSIYKGLYQDPKTSPIPHQGETFDQYIQRMGISEEEVQKRIIFSQKRILLYLALSTIVLIYMSYLYATGFTRAALLTTILLVVLLTYTFKEHFQYYQLKRRKLRSSLKEWFFDFFKRA